MSDYYTLLTALPWLPSLEQCKQLPISRIALDKRLTMLTDQDRAQLVMIESLYHPNWSHYEGQVDQNLVAVWQRKLNEVESSVLVEQISFNMELRTFLAALRSRARGLENPDLFYGIGRWVTRIRKHWFEPSFGLDEISPELKQLQRILAKENPILLEQYINRQLWGRLSQAERQSCFSFDALACYVLRWSIAEQILQDDSDVALQQFNGLNQHLLASSSLQQQLAEGSLE